MGPLRIVAPVLVLCLSVAADVDAGSRSRRGCYAPAACCPQPIAYATPCQTCTPAATCCQPRAAGVALGLPTKAPNTICPCFPCMNWGSYTSYYAVYCDEGTPAVMLDGINLTIGDPICTGNGDCVDAPALVRGKKAKHAFFHHPNKPEKKPKLSELWDPEAPLRPDQSVTLQPIGDAIVVRFEAKIRGNKEWVDVQLRRLLVIPKSGEYQDEALTLRTGQQVKKTTVNPVAVNGSVDFDGGNKEHVIYITHNDVRYQVVTADELKKP